MHVLPDDVQQKVRSLSNGSTVHLALESDLDENGNIGRRYLVATDERLLVLSPDHGDPAIDHDILIRDVLEVKAEPYIGSGCLTANVDGRYVHLIRYSNSVAREFGYGARVLTALNKGEPPPQATDDDRTRRCPTCGFPLEAQSEVCRNCVNRLQAISRLLAYLKPYKHLVALTVALMISAQVLRLAPPYLTKILIDDVLRVAEPFKGHVPPLLHAGLMRSLGLIVIGLIATSVSAMALDIVQTRLNAFLGGKVTHDVRMELYSSLHRMPVSFFDKRQTGSVISRVSQDASSLQEFLTHNVQFFITNSLMLVLVLVILFRENWKLAALTLIPAPLVSVGARMVFKRIRWMFRKMWHRWSQLHSAMSDSLQGLRVVKAFAQENREIQRFNERSTALYEANVEANQAMGTIMPLLQFFLTSGQFIVWYAGGIGVINVGVTTGTLVMFIGYIGMLYGPLQIVTRMWDWMSRNLAAAERIFEVMDAEPEEPQPEKQTHVGDLKGRVAFNNVSFGYDPNNPVLHEITLEIEPGEMIGLVGHSGAGKSTLINLLARFYTPQSGSITIDGVDTREMSVEDLRRQIGIVAQDPYLFSGTIMDNIAYARPSATAEEIIRAAKAANAHDFIVNFPDGYDTQVGERGQSLSGGERQRISIARAILHNPRILILDEATSSVDTGTEKQIQEALLRLVEDRTTFAIAHRLSTLRNADRLLVLDHGKLAELGTHEELMEKGGVYAKLVEMQTEMNRIVAVGG